MRVPIFQRMGITEAQFIVWLSEKTNQGLSCPSIGKELGISGTAVHVWMRKFGIPRRRPQLRDRDFLYDAYVNKRLSTGEIAKILNCTGTAVQQYLNVFGIPIRGGSERQKNRRFENEKPNRLHSVGSNCKPRSYCFWYDGHWFASTAEYIFYKSNRSKIQRIQPFVYKNKRPDFLLFDGTVVETKYQRRSLSTEALAEYLEYGTVLEQDLGLKYEIVFVYDQYKQEYDNALKWLRKNAVIGVSFTLLSEI